ncbi:MAG: precorrin-4 C(11)-methyltransferase [Nitrospinota bacterium]|nr:precorrin-4 C(11)-methyltransferase [Nitrospinota bacterium]MDH5756816.1 precorrin-4 C(11)-methyltransferase [Nitrospinota bacterium]
MKVHFVGSGPGDPELLTLKAKRILENCQILIYAGSLVSDAIVAMAPESAERHDSAGMDLEAIVSVIENASSRDMDVVRLHSGDPSIYGAIREQIAELEKRGIEYDVTPGISSFQASAAALGVELTVPEKSQTIILTRMAGRTPVPEEQDMERLAATRSTLCVFLSVDKISGLAETVERHYGAGAPMAVVFHASRPDQLIIRGTTEDIAAKVKEAGVRKTAMIVVGDALGRGAEASLLYDKSFSHEYRKAGA